MTIRLFGKHNAADQIRSELADLYPRLWRFCLSMTGSVDLAADLAQASSLRALEKAAQFKQGTNFAAWVFTLAKRLWIDEMRKAAVRRGSGLANTDEIELVDLGPDTETNILARQTFSKVMELPEAQRAAVLLVYVEGYSYKEAAEIMEIPIGTVMSRLSAARGKLTNQEARERKVG